jgi:hypothetical protein
MSDRYCLAIVAIKKSREFFRVFSLFKQKKRKRKEEKMFIQCLGVNQSWILIVAATSILMYIK